VSEDHPLMMKCGKCGEMNRLPVVHCKRCGAKLDFEKAEKEMRNIGKPTIWDRIGGAVKLGVAMALAAVLLLAVWPNVYTCDVGEPVDARRYLLKTELLVEALNRGLPASQVLLEKEINARMRQILEAQPPRQGFTTVLEDVGVQIGADRAEAFIAMGKGPLTLTSRFYVEVDGGELSVVGAELGHLPLPGVLGRLYAKTQEGLLRQFRNESRILRNLDGARIAEREVELLVKLGK
jgi:hypothetical protein